MAEILTADGLFVTANSACLTRQVETGDINNEEEEALLSEKTEISEEVITLLDTKVYKGATFHKESILDVQTLQTYWEFLLVAPTRCHKKAL